MRGRRLAAAGAVAALGFALAREAAAQSINVEIGGGQGGSLTGQIVQFMALLTVLSVAPGILIMATSFVRIIIVLSLLRSGLGLQQTPPNMVLVSLALFLTAFVMAPVFDQAWRDGLRPLLAGSITEEQAFERISGPFRGFLSDNVREKDLALFDGLAATIYDAAAQDRQEPPPVGQAGEADPQLEVDLRTLLPAFMISELRRGFEVGFLVFLPFLIIDMVVAAVLMAMGMMMLPPVIISLPFKLIFFVLIDGWYVLSGGLIRSYIGG